MSKILIDRAVVEQVLDFCEFTWRDVPMNDYAFERLEQTIATFRASLAEQLEQDRHQTFIDTLPDHLDGKMFEQIDLWARQTYKRHQSQVRGQMFDSRDSHQTPLIYAAFRWAKEHGNPLGDATDAPQPAKSAEQEPVAWIDITDEGQIVSSPRMYSDGSREERPLYTSPQPRRRLTDEEICAALDIDGSDDWTFTVAYAIIAAYERKNGIGEQP